MRRRTSTVLSGLVALVASSLLVVPTGAAGAAGAADEGETAPASIPPPLDYVALGDSYSAASGVLPVDPLAPPECLRSTRNYPAVIAERTGAALTDVTCGAAETRDYREAQHPDVPPQLDALSRRTDLVTMTIGGNDSGVFLDSITSCTTLGLSTAGQGSPCRDEHGSSYVDTIRQVTYPDLVRALRAVQRRARRAEVAILGYPWIMPRTEGCFAAMPVAEGDVPYLRNIQRVLNNAVRRAADATGSTYVDLNRASDGHDACQPLGTRWVEPVLQGTNPVVVHPNALGEQRMAARALRVLGLR